jgi:hypothetical protein
MALVLQGDGDITGLVAGALPSTVIGTGAVLQVISNTSTASIATTGTSYVASSLNATITPTSSTSKILILVTFWQSSSASGVTNATTIYRNSTDLATGASLGMQSHYLTNSAGETNGVIHYIDSPSTTSSTTYTLYFKRADSAGTVTIGTGTRLSSITLMEIAG